MKQYIIDILFVKLYIIFMLDSNRIYYVYLLIDKRTSLPFYVGKGKNGRAEFHLVETEEETHNIQKWRKIQKLKSLGLDIPIHYVFTDLEENAAYDIEAKLIEFWGRKNIDQNGILTNICQDNRPPSPLGLIRSKETKNKISVGNSKKKRSKQARYNMSKKKKGQIPCNANTSKRRIKKNPEKYTPEVIQKIKDAASKREKKKKDLGINYAAIRAKKILCVETGKIFESISKAAESVKGMKSNISNVAKGKLHSAYGYTWKFV